MTQGGNRQVTVSGAIEVTAGTWIWRPGRRRAAGFTAFPDQLPRAFPRAPVIAVICDNGPSATPGRSPPAWGSIPGRSGCTAPGTARTTIPPGGSGRR